MFFFENVFHHIVIGQVVSGHVGEDWHIALAENLKKLHQKTILRVKHYKKNSAGGGYANCTGALNFKPGSLRKSSLNLKIKRRGLN